MVEAGDEEIMTLCGEIRRLFVLLLFLKRKLPLDRILQGTVVVLLFVYGVLLGSFELVI